MRLLHPKTINILANHPEFPKTHLAHAWSEVFKFLAQNKTHPKMFLKHHYYYGAYLKHVYKHATKIGCRLDKEKILNLSSAVVDGFVNGKVSDYNYYFDPNYLFSDACSLYYKGINIFPDIFGDEWRKYVPVESHKEIIRQCNKTLTKKL